MLNLLSRRAPLLVKEKAAGRILAAANYHSQQQQDGHQQQQRFNKGSLAAVALGGSLAVGAGLAYFSREERALLASEARKRKRPAGYEIPGLRTYTMAEVRQHDCKEKGIWVTYRSGVYDITEFIPKHPGAQNIMMAAGGPVEPFWETYAVHKNNDQVTSILEEYRIGNLDEADSERALSRDPYRNEPKRHPALKPSSLKPFNAETPPKMLIKHFYTPNEIFYVRSHLPTPDIKPGEYELEISGEGVKEQTLSLEELKKFPKFTITAAIQCGGNRRAEMNNVRPLKGLQSANWDAGAIGNATWTGARLYDVLKSAGLKDGYPEARHIQFEGYDLGADGSAYGASIPVEKGFNPQGDVLLAYEMNGQPLPRDHGQPVRLVVPGVVGARNVKWLNRITVSDSESENHWQKSDYKGFGPWVTWDDVEWDKAQSIQEMPVTSAICAPNNGSAQKAGEIEVKGYAWSGGGNRILRVDITLDGGKTWREADITHQDHAVDYRHYGWTLWSAKLDCPKDMKEVTVWSKAVDSSYNVQPESFENIWNLRGLLNNAYGKVHFTVH